MNRALLCLFFIEIVTSSIFGDSNINIFNQIFNKENQIPMFDIQYEIPETLVGEFIIVTPMANCEITIFPNKEYIVIVDAPSHDLWNSFGYIIEIDNNCYFSPGLGQRKYFNELTQIHYTNFGFFYYDEFLGRLRAIRKKDIPLPVSECFAEKISISKRIVKYQYFDIQGFDKLEFNEIENLPHHVLPLYHYLQIDNGIVSITSTFGIDGEIYTIFEGFIEEVYSSTDIIRGIIHFTNGVPYFYIDNGTAEIELNTNGSIKITMLFSPDSRYQREIPGIQFPANLILEF